MFKHSPLNPPLNIVIKTDRSMTRDEWKAADRWRRSTRRLINQCMEDNVSAVKAFNYDVAVYGSGGLLLQNFVPPVAGKLSMRPVRNVWRKIHDGAGDD